MTTGLDAEGALALLPWFRRAARDLPWRRPGFPAWGTLVSEIMLQQTQVARVAPRLEAWLERWPTPAALADAPTPEVLAAWRGLGYPRRALALQAAAVQIVERHGGEVPTALGDLLALPGVGPYTARAVATFAHGQRQAVVDTNVRRVVARAVHGRAEAGPPRASDLADVDALLPADAARAAPLAAALMELGAIVCTARAPRCDDCPIREQCAWRAAGFPPHEGPRARRQARFEGSDRQARGAILSALVDAGGPIGIDELAAVVPDERRPRAIEGLVRDGLAVRVGDALTLPD